MRALLAMAVILGGCAHAPPLKIDSESLVGLYWNGDGFWPRKLNLRSDGTFYYLQQTDLLAPQPDDTFLLEGSWGAVGRWKFTAPDRVELEMASPDKMARELRAMAIEKMTTRSNITLHVRASPRQKIALLEPDLIPDVLKTWGTSKAPKFSGYLERLRSDAESKPAADQRK